MSDNSVFIDGIRWRDAQQDHIPLWATETSMQEANKHLKDLARTNRAQAEAVIEGLRSSNEQLAKRLSDNIESVFESEDSILEDMKKGGKQAVENEKKKGVWYKITGKHMESAGRSTSRFTGGITDTIAEMSGMRDGMNIFIQGPLRHLGRSVEAVTDGLGKLGRAGPAVASAFGLLMAAFGRLVAVVQDAANFFRESNNIGIRGLRTAQELYNQLAELGMTSQSLISIVKNYSTAMGTFGVQALNRMVRSANEATGGLHQFALTNEEAAQYAAETLEQERLMGRFRLVDQAAQNRALRENITRLSAYSTMLNISRDEIMKSTTDILRQDQIRALTIGRQGFQGAEALTTVIQLFSALGKEGDVFKNLFADMTGALDPMMVDGLYDFLPFAGDAAMELADFSRQVRSGNVGAEAAEDTFFRFGAALRANADVIQQQAFMGNEQARRTAAFLAAYEESVERVLKVGETIDSVPEAELRRRIRERAEADAAAARSASMLQNSLNQLRPGFNRVLLAFTNVLIGKGDGSIEGMFEIMAKRAEEFADWLLAAGGRLNAFLGDTNERGFFSRLNGALKAVFNIEDSWWRTFLTKAGDFFGEGLTKHLSWMFRRGGGRAAASSAGLDVATAYGGLGASVVYQTRAREETEFVRAEVERFQSAQTPAVRTEFVRQTLGEVTAVANRTGMITGDELAEVIDRNMTRMKEELEKNNELTQEEKNEITEMKRAMRELLTAISDRE